MGRTVDEAYSGGKIKGSVFDVLNLRFLIRQLNEHVLWALRYLSLKVRREVWIGAIRFFGHWHIDRKLRQ